MDRINEQEGEKEREVKEHMRKRFGDAERWTEMERRCIARVGKQESLRGGAGLSSWEKRRHKRLSRKTSKGKTRMLLFKTSIKHGGAERQEEEKGKKERMEGEPSAWVRLYGHEYEDGQQRRHRQEPTQ